MDDREIWHKLLDYALDNKADFVITQVANLGVDGTRSMKAYRMHLNKKEWTIKDE